MTPASAHPAKLIVKVQGHGSRTLELQGECCTIGRKPDNDLPIDDHTASGHHARIVKVQAVYFLEDLNSTNGTSVNDRRVQRHQLRDADVITIGRHRIIFQEPATPADTASTDSADLDQTMVIAGNSAAAPAIDGKLLVTRGKTDRMEYRLTRPVNLIGAQEGAAIRLTGWFAPKSAAQISRRGGLHVISPVQGGKCVTVNGQEVSVQQSLKDGDEIEVAGITLMYYQMRQAA